VLEKEDKNEGSSMLKNKRKPHQPVKKSNGLQMNFPKKSEEEPAQKRQKTSPLKEMMMDRTTASQDIESAPISEDIE